MAAIGTVGRSPLAALRREPTVLFTAALLVHDGTQLHMDGTSRMS